MTCVSCVITLESIFSSLPAFAHSSSSVSVTLLPQKVVLIYDASSLSEHDIKNIILDAGFDVVLCNTEILEKEKNAVSVVNLLISGMTCASCSSSIENSLRSMSTGIVLVGISVVTGKARIEFDAHRIGQRDIIDKINDMGFDAVLDSSADSKLVLYLN